MQSVIRGSVMSLGISYCIDQRKLTRRIENSGTASCSLKFERDAVTMYLRRSSAVIMYWCLFAYMLAIISIN